MAKTIDEMFGADTFDSRDVIERIEELESIADEDEDGNFIFEDESDKEEHALLTEFRDEVEGYCVDFEYGEQFIADSYFEEYAQQLAEDIGAIDRDAAWPANYIDWEAAADALKMDYTSVEIQGQDYWYR